MGGELLRNDNGGQAWGPTVIRCDHLIEYPGGLLPAKGLYKSRSESFKSCNDAGRTTVVMALLAVKYKSQRTIICPISNTLSSAVLEDDSETHVTKDLYY